jgi:hypothetical protein
LVSAFILNRHRSCRPAGDKAGFFLSDFTQAPGELMSQDYGKGIISFRFAAAIAKHQPLVPCSCFMAWLFIHPESYINDCS